MPICPIADDPRCDDRACAAVDMSHTASLFINHSCTPCLNYSTLATHLAATPITASHSVFAACSQRVVSNSLCPLSAHIEDVVDLAKTRKSPRDCTQTCQMPCRLIPSTLSILPIPSCQSGNHPIEDNN